MVPKGVIYLDNTKIKAENFHVTYSSNSGVFPAKNRFIWANGNGYLNNSKKIGLNFGYGLQHFNKSMHTEDAFFIEGKIYKLNAVKSEPFYNSRQKTKRSNEETNEEKLEWNFYNYDNDYNDKGVNYCDVIFTPFSSSYNSLNFLMNEVNLRKFFGSFRGLCKDFNGNKYTFNNVIGVIEDKEYVW